jgi:hypothetical protein
LRLNPRHMPDGFSITDGSGNNEAIGLGRGAVQEQFAYTVFEHKLLERWDPNGGQIGSYYRLTAKDVGPYAKSTNEE